jgi:hypothetical protein
MKQFKIIILILPFIALRVNAQLPNKSLAELNKSERKNAIKVNLLSPFYSTINISYQHVLSNTGSLNITASYMDFDAYGSENSNIVSNSSYYGSYGYGDRSQRTQGFAITPEYRYALNGKGLSGFYLGPFLRYMYYEYSETYEVSGYYYNSQGNYVYLSQTGSDLFTYHTVALGAVIGKQFVFKNKVTIDFFGGPVYSVLAASNHSKQDDVVIGSGIPNVYIQGYGIRGGITVGFAY